MSSIKLSPNASGTGEFTIAAPNSNTNRTLTLPDATGAFNISGAVNEVPAGSASAPSIYPTGDTNTGIFFPAADTIAFSEGGAEAMRLDASGNLLVGTTTATVNGRSGRMVVAQSGDSLLLTQNSNTSYTAYSYVSTGSGTRYHIGFADGSTASTGTVGNITTNGSSTSYGTTSDYRLKENIAPMVGALATVAALKPVIYNWKSTGAASQGFIAHELQAVVPECVTGEKDAVDAEGNPVYQGIDTSFLVATLTAAIQELNAKVEAQAAEIAALKGAQ